MALSFKFPKLGKARSNEAPLTITEDAPLLQPRAATSTAEKSATQQMKKLGGIFALLLAVIAIFVVQDSRNATHATAYVAAAGEMPEQLYASVGFAAAGLQRGVQRMGESERASP